MIRARWLLAPLVLLCAQPAAAQTFAPGTIDIASKLVATMKLEGLLDKMFEQITPLVTTSVIAQIDKVDKLPAAVKAELNDPAAHPRVEAIMSQEVLKAYRAHIGDILAAVAKEYAASFSEADLRAALAFYQSPAGQHFIEAQPRLQATMTQRGQEIGRSAAMEAIPAAMARIAQIDTNSTTGAQEKKP